MAEKIFEFSSAVRGFYYYRKYWQPQLDDELYCQHELENPFDFFALTICQKNHRCYSWRFTNGDFQSNEVSTWQRSDSFY